MHDRKSATGIQPRPELEHVPSVPHGGFHCRSTLMPEPADLLDFSANVNPFGPSPRIWDAMRTVPIEQHPDPRATPLRLFLAEHLGVEPRQLLVGNGSVDLIYHLAVAYLRTGDRVLVVEPTFGEYAAAAAMMGAEVVRYRTDPATHFALDIEAFLALARKTQPRLLFLCNPNNPTGTYLNQEAIVQILTHCPDTLCVLDEAFVRFVPTAWSLLDVLASASNLLILRSLTKDYALTGLRVGYALSHPPIIAALEKVQPPWSVNTLAQAAAIAALQDEEYLQTTLTTLARASHALAQDLVRIRLWPLPSRTHFCLLPVPSADVWTRELYARQILVRDCSSFGLPTYIRLAARGMHDNARLVAALAEIGGRRCPAGC